MTTHILKQLVSHYIDRAPWLAFAPGGAILLAVMGFNFLGDAIRDALDPRLPRASGTRSPRG